MRGGGKRGGVKRRGGSRRDGGQGTKGGGGGVGVQGIHEGLMFFFFCFFQTVTMRIGPPVIYSLFPRYS